jgi:hypothetical protein
MRVLIAALIVFVAVGMFICSCRDKTDTAMDRRRLLISR